MTARHNGAASAAPTFDAAAWLSDWTEHGGLVATIGDRLWIGRTPCLDRSAKQRLNSIRGGIMQPGAGTALAGILRGLSVGEEA